VHLAKLGFLTRIPATRKLVAQVISQALQGALWPDVGAGTRSQPMALCHYGMAQRWLGVCSQAARERAEKSVNQAQQRAGEAIKQPLLHLPAKRFETPDPALAALAAVSKSWRSHQVDTPHRLEHKR
jgi:transposase